MGEAKPCEVLHAGRWVPGTVEAWRRDPDGWRGYVRYTVEPGATLSALAASQRPAAGGGQLTDWHCRAGPSRGMRARRVRLTSDTARAGKVRGAAGRYLIPATGGVCGFGVDDFPAVTGELDPAGEVQTVVVAGEHIRPAGAN